MIEADLNLAFTAIIELSNFTSAYSLFNFKQHPLAICKNYLKYYNKLVKQTKNQIFIILNPYNSPLTYNSIRLSSYFLTNMYAIMKWLNLYSNKRMKITI